MNFRLLPTPKIVHINEGPPATISGSTVRTYDLFYTFGTAARHLSIVAPWTHADGVTRTIPAGTNAIHGSAIESTITTPDGAVFPFRLEGNNTDPDAPIIVLVNSVLTTYHIWDSFLSSFFSNPRITASASSASYPAAAPPTPAAQTQQQSTSSPPT